VSAPWVVLRAADAPAPTLVVDGSALPAACPRGAAETLLEQVRTEALAALPAEPGLGVKNIVVFAPRDALLRVEFFQGYAHGELVPDSQQVCVNSLACAVVAATGWHADFEAASPWTALMAVKYYVLRREASGTNPEHVADRP
jgi:hypothetical protein